ncbi:hypothetical protein BC826DRAFT_970605 [Russula brevipes]|nr:hypothetical protein BC826DRAFT_970605 [Russula brevipes]
MTKHMGKGGCTRPPSGLRRFAPWSGRFGTYATRWLPTLWSSGRKAKEPMEVRSLVMVTIVQELMTSCGPAFMGALSAFLTVTHPGWIMWRAESMEHLSLPLMDSKKNPGSDSIRIRLSHDRKSVFSKVCNVTSNPAGLRVSGKSLRGRRNPLDNCGGFVSVFSELRFSDQISLRTRDKKDISSSHAVRCSSYIGHVSVGDRVTSHDATPTSEARRIRSSENVHKENSDAQARNNAGIERTFIVRFFGRSLFRTFGSSSIKREKGELDQPVPSSEKKKKKKSKKEKQKMNLAFSEGWKGSEEGGEKINKSFNGTLTTNGVVSPISYGVRGKHSVIDHEFSLVLS